MKVAVTGAGGFVGGHVLRALEQVGGCEVVAVMRTAAGELRLPPGGRAVQFDLAETADDVFDRLGRPDVLIHLAWGGLPNYMSLHHFEDELPAQYRFLKAMVAGGLGAAVVTGTCFEYGMVNGALTEDMVPAPANPYAYAKVMLLRQLELLQAKLPFALTWARLFYMWGPGQAPTSIYPLLAAAAARGDALFPMSGGEQLRDYLPVEKVARLLVALALQRANVGVVNVCSGRPVSVRNLVERWIADRGWSIEPELGRYPYPSYEPLAFWGSDEKLQSCLA